MGHCNRSTYLSGADFTKVNLNFEFLNSFPLLGEGTEGKIYYLTPPLLSCRLFSPPPNPILKKDIPLHTLGTGGFFSRATRSFVGRQVFGDLTDLTESKDRA